MNGSGAPPRAGRNPRSFTVPASIRAVLSPWTQVAGHIQDEDALISQIAVSPLIVVLLPALLMGVWCCQAAGAGKPWDRNGTVVRALV